MSAWKIFIGELYLKSQSIKSTIDILTKYIGCGCWISNNYGGCLYMVNVGLCHQNILL